MIGQGTKDRLRYLENIRQLEVGVTLATKHYRWVITQSERLANTTYLTLKCGRHQVKVHIPMCHWGPEFPTGLRFVSHAPTQRELFRHQPERAA